MVILLGNGILGCKPNILLQIQTIVEASPCKTSNGIILVVQALNNAVGILEIKNQLTGFFAFCIGNNQFCLRTLLHFHFGVLINIAISVTSNCNRLCPSRNIRFNTLYQNRGAEYSSVQNGTNCTVRAFPHLGKMIFRHSCSIRGDGCTLYSNAIL